MAPIKLKPLPQLLAPESFVLELVPFVAVSGAMAYSETSKELFATSEGALIMGLGIIVDTPLNGTGVSLKIGDGTTVDKYLTLVDSLLVAGSVFQWVMKEESTYKVITATLDGGTSTAGSIRAFVMYKPKGSAQSYLKR